MGAELSNNTFWTAVGVIGAGVVGGIVRLLSGSHSAQENRIDGLLREQGALNQRLETMATKIGQLEGKVENLEKHRDELITENTGLKAKLEEKRIAEVTKDLEIASLKSTNTELYEDLERVQSDLLNATKVLAANNLPFTPTPRKPKPA